MPPPSISNASSAFSGPRWIDPHAGCHAPISIMHEIERAETRADVRELVVEAGVAEKKTRRFGVVERPTTTTASCCDREGRAPRSAAPASR